jgi:antitoxin PrlF
MSTTLSVKGQITIPKQIRDMLGLKPGMLVEFVVNQDGEMVIRKAEVFSDRKPNRFEAVRGKAVRGKADVMWRSKDLIALLRGED